MVKLGVNIDHVATVRQARGVNYPDPIEAAKICEESGCDSIVCHLREDRRHIIDDDLTRLKGIVRTRLNLEMSIASGIVEIARKMKPDQATLVPEKREEITTEGGLEVIEKKKEITDVVERLKSSGIEVSLFIDPGEEYIKAAKEIGVSIIELHTGQYANAAGPEEISENMEVLRRCTAFALDLGLTVNAGHGLNYENVRPVARIKGLEELNIGHSIVAYAVLYGLGNAVKTMKELIT